MVRLVFLLVFLLPSSGFADEAFLPDGRQLTGKLATDQDGHLRFVALPVGSPLPLEQVEYIRFADCEVPYFRVAAPFRATLRNGDFLSGELLGLDADKLLFRTAWAERLTIPRKTLASLTQALGCITLFHEDFETNLKDWKLEGSLQLSSEQHDSGKRSLSLKNAGDAATYQLPTPVAAGRTGISLFSPEKAGLRRYVVELQFGTRLVQTVVAGEKNYVAEDSHFPSRSASLPRKPGWRRLQVEFSADTLVVSIDELVLWSARKQGSVAALNRVRVACIGPSTPAGEPAFFDDFSVARTDVRPVHPKGDRSQDELWLVSGDQLFGRVTQTTKRVIEIEIGKRSRTVGWEEVRSIYFRESPTAPPSHGKEPIRVRLRSGVGFEPDSLQGDFQQLNQEKLVLHHEVLGNLTVDRKRLQRLGSVR
jgi:hypothetical protein